MIVWKHKNLEALAVDRQKDFRHPTVEGLYLRAAPTGRKSWLFVRVANGTRINKTFARFPAMSMIEAQQRAAEFNEAVDRGEDPFAVEEEAPTPTPTRMTVESAWERYIEDCERRELRRINELEDTFRRDGQAIKSICVRDVTGDDIRAILARPIERAKGKNYDGRASSNLLYRQLKAFFNFCLVNDYDDIVKSPLRGIKQLKLINAKPKTILSIREMAVLILAARELDKRNEGNTTWADAVTLLVLLGCRKNEVFEAMGDEYLDKAGLWTIPASRYKTFVEPTIGLPPTAKAIFDRRAVRGKFLIPAQSGIRTGQDRHIIDKLTAIMEELGGKPVAKWSFHCTRYSFRSGIRKAKIADSELAERLIHPGRSLEMSQHYDPDMFDEMKAALAAWDALIAAEIQTVIAERMAAVA